MSVHRTLGRRPTPGEVIEYYTRDDFRQFLLDTSRVRPVVMIVSKARHWAARWQEDIIHADDEQMLGEYIVRRIRTELPDLDDGDRPSFYPSFHQLIGKWREGQMINRLRVDRPPPMREMDCVLEADRATWQESFQDVLPVLDLMDVCGVRYQHKLSGHRSLHVTLPGGMLPLAYRGKGAKRVLQPLREWYGCKAHYLSQINRMPYSLNEDTGLVCLPIRRGALDAFRPWQAILHLVEIDDAWQEEIGKEDRAKAEAFLEALNADLVGGTLPTRKVSAARNRTQIVPQYKDRLSDPREGAGETAWRLLVGSSGVTEETLQAGLACSDQDARWLTVEAFLLHGTGLSEEGCLQLMSQTEEYVRAVAMDVLLRFEDDLYEHALGFLGDLEHYLPVTLTLSSLMARSDSLRTRVLDAFSRRPDRADDALPVAACAMGAMTGDWDSAFRLLEPLHAATGATEKGKALSHAVVLMSTLGGWDRERGWHPKAEAKKRRALASLGPDVVDLLLVAALSPNEVFRNSVVAALALIGDARAASVLVSYLGYDLSGMRWKAIAGLVRIGEDAVDPLIEAAASDQPHVRRNALLCLGRIGSPQARSVLLEALDDSDWRVRRQAIKALNGLVTPRDIERLKQALREETWDNALLATEAVARMGEEGEGILLGMTLQEHNPAAAYAVAARGDPRGRDVLVGWLSAEGKQLQDVVELLRELGDERCVPFIAERLRRIGGEQGMSAALALGQVEGDIATAALIQVLASDDRLTRRGAVRALGTRQDPAIIDPMIEYVAREEDPKNRDLAVRALERMGERAIEALRKALEGDRIQGKRRRSAVKRMLWRAGKEM